MLARPLQWPDAERRRACPLCGTTGVSGLGTDAIRISQRCVAAVDDSPTAPDLLRGRAAARDAQGTIDDDAPRPHLDDRQRSLLARQHLAVTAAATMSS